VTSYFHYGLAESAAANPIARRGFPTVVQLDPKRPTVVNYIMAVAAIPRGFDRVHSIEANNDDDGVTLRADSGAAVSVALDLSFLRE
jgi:hypothetical protein